MAGVASKASGRFLLSKESKVNWDAFYRKVRASEGSEATARIDLHAMKLGLLYAILAGHSQIEEDDIQSAIDVATHCAAVVEPLAKRLDMSHMRKLEEKLLRCISSSGSIKPRDLYRKLGVTAGVFESLIRPLTNIGRIVDIEGQYRLGV